MTPTQIELHNAHMARLQRIAQAAARVNPKTDKELFEALNTVEPENVGKPKDEWARRQIEKNRSLFFSVIDCSELPERGRPTVRAIQLATCEAFGVELSDVISARRTGDLILPRHVSMYLAKEMTPASYPKIAKATGDRDHTVAIHAHRKIKRLIETDPELKNKVEVIRGRFE